MSMAGRQRILGALEGEAIDRVSFAINHWQWFYSQQYWGTLPQAVQHCQTPIEFMKENGADIITRWDGQIKVRGGMVPAREVSSLKLPDHLLRT